MDNRFLFRGKGVNTCEWFTGSLINIENEVFTASFIVKNDTKLGFCRNNNNEEIRSFFDCCEVNPETIGQCTGLRDKNNKLIFEGDTVIWLGDIWTVAFDDGKWCYNDRINPMSAFDRIKVEIIGNIHGGECND